MSKTDIWRYAYQIDVTSSKFNEISIHLWKSRMNDMLIKSIREKITEEDEEYIPFEVFSYEEIVKRMEDIVEKVSSFSNLPKTIVRILLNESKWVIDKLSDKLYNSENKKRLEDIIMRNNVIHAKLLAYNQMLEREKEENNNNEEETIGIQIKECSTCLQYVSSLNIKVLNCGHKLCKDCWCEYLTSKIMEDGISQTIVCPNHKCNFIIDKDFITELVNKDVKDRYMSLLTNSFVESNNFLTWCPQPNCSNVIEVARTGQTKVTCNCGLTFCFGCGNVWHDPIDCRLMKHWMQKFSHYKVASRWRRRRERSKWDIQKSDPEFHYFMLEDDVLYKRKQNKKKTRKVQGYSYYLKKYKAHKKCIKHEKDMAKVFKEDNPDFCEWFKTKVAVLRQCRETLMYTYAFTFYLKKCNWFAKELVMKLENLNRITFTLQGYLDDVMGAEIKLNQIIQIQDYASYCAIQRKDLLNMVHIGYDNDLHIFYKVIVQ